MSRVFREPVFEYEQKLVHLIVARIPDLATAHNNDKIEQIRTEFKLSQLRVQMSKISRNKEVRIEKYSDTDIFGDRIEVERKFIRLWIPYTGSRKLWSLQPDFSKSIPEEFDIDTNQVSFEINLDLANRTEQIKEAIEANVNNINKFVPSLNSLIDETIKKRITAIENDAAETNKKLDDLGIPEN